MQESKHLKSVNNTDILLGKHPESGLEIYTGVWKYGPYVKILQDDEGKNKSVEKNNRFKFKQT